MSIVQAPVRYSCRATPTRAGVYKPPYTIINVLDPDVNGTVWLADNAGLMVGGGTPLYPGTSLTWTQEGELWVVTDVEPTDIIVSYDVQDWEVNPAAVAVAVLNSGLLLIDDPETLFSGPIDAGNGFTTPFIDITRYQSLRCAFEASALSGNNYDAINFSFWETETSPVAIFNRTFWINNLTDNADRWEGTVPAVAAFVKVGSGITSTPFGVSVIGSHRSQPGVEQEIQYVGPNAIVKATPVEFYFNVIAPFVGGTTLSIDLAPWIGEMELDVGINSATAPAANSEARWTKRNPSTGGFNAFRRLGFTPLAAGGTIYTASDRIAVAGDSLRLDIVNTGANPAGNWANINIRVVPVSGMAQVA